jgi:hypothetical protein
MQFDQKDPFGYPIGTYLWVFGLALIGGAVKYLNQNSKFSLLVLVRDLVTACFAGLLTFWVCEWTNISGPLSAVFISIAGLMGTRAIREIENLYRLRMGFPVEDEEKEKEHQRFELDVHVDTGAERKQGRAQHEGE